MLPHALSRYANWLGSYPAPRIRARPCRPPCKHEGHRTDEAFRGRRVRTWAGAAHHAQAGRVHRANAKRMPRYPRGTSGRCSTTTSRSRHDLSGAHSDGPAGRFWDDRAALRGGRVLRSCYGTSTTASDRRWMCSLAQAAALPEDGAKTALAMSVHSDTQRVNKRSFPPHCVKTATST
ncbi:hypothetical protein PsYK624_101450 [Phanerochaete sordida]|uniref:Uncharacterized protein n=1 Tax=Phanerochaete sordida TaxID=48140 RepID=A0A9P3GDA1_9APHY|nr:hypothetical protein PsYK624_101450 [Phanerochaete sordida]